MTENFTIVLKRAPDYRIFLAQTIYGGPVPDASGILMNVCVDHAAFPSYIVHPLSEDGKTVNMAQVQDQAQVGNVEREVLCGVYFTLDQARRTANWLTGIIQNIERGTHE